MMLGVFHPEYNDSYRSMPVKVMDAEIAAMVAHLNLGSRDEQS
jgi:hypothetical protein